MVAVAVLVGVVAMLLILRGRRKATLAGLNGDRPTFAVEPPSRRVSSRKHEAL